MSERSTTQLKQPIIRFGPDDDSAKKVANVKIFYKDGSIWDMLKGQKETNYDRITILKNCNELYCIFYVNDNKPEDEVFIPIHNISRIQVKHFGKEKAKIES